MQFYIEHVIYYKHYNNTIIQSHHHQSKSMSSVSAKNDTGKKQVYFSVKFNSKRPIQSV